MSIFGDRVRAKRRGLWDDTIAPRREPPPPIYIYVAAGDRIWRALTVEGEEVFSIQQEGNAYGMLDITADGVGNIYVCTRQRVQKWTADALAWEVDRNGSIYSALAAQADGSAVYYSDTSPSRIVALDAKGNEHWTNISSGISQRARCVGDYLYAHIQGTTNRLRRIDPSTGAEIWTISPHRHEFKYFDVDPDGYQYYGTIAAPSGQGRIAKYDAAGNLVQRLGRSGLPDLYRAVAIDDDRSVFGLFSPNTGTHYYYSLEKYTPGGDLIWEVEQPTEARTAAATGLIVDRAGNSYVSRADGTIRSYSPTGEHRWTYQDPTGSVVAIATIPLFR